jgi:RNA polymerase sigma factor (sigma-70 family)
VEQDKSTAKTEATAKNVGFSEKSQTHLPSFAHTIEETIVGGQLMSRPDLPLLRQLRSMLDAPAQATRTDRELLDAFACRRDEAAFAALVRRHGTMVLNVCRHVLRQEQDAEDAFQAVFLVLSRKANALGSVVSIVGWLHEVAHRTALSARKSSARRQTRPRLRSGSEPEQPIAEASLRELQALLDAEVARLPEKLRSPFVLCCLEGRHKTEAARDLGWKPGTVSSRLALARERLRERLRRRGVTLSAALAAVALTAEPARAALATATVRVCGQYSVGGKVAAPAAAALAREALRSLTWKPIKFVGIVLVLVASAGGLTRAVLQNDSPAAHVQSKQDADPVVKVEESSVKLDTLGDPLPQGAIARLGSLRLYHGTQVNRITLSPDGKWLVSSGGKGSRLWDTATGKETPLDADLKNADFLATKDKFVAVKETGGRILWDPVANKEIKKLDWEIGPGDRVALAPDGNTFVWASHGGFGKGKLTFADLANNKVMQAVDLDKGKLVWDMIFSADGNVLTTHYSNNSVDVWDVKSHTPIFSVTLKSQSLGQLGLSPDGRTLAAALYDESKKVYLWDIRAKKELPPLAVQQGRVTSAVSFSPDGKMLAVTYEGEIGLWDLATSKEIGRLKGKGPGFSRPVFARDGKRLAAGDGNAVSIWNLADGQQCHDLGHTYALDAVAISPDGRTIATGAAYTDSVVRTWDSLTGRLKTRWTGHKEGLEAIAYSPDGKLIASGSQDGTVRLWDTAAGKEAGCLEGKDGMIYGMTFSPDGKTLVAGGRLKVAHFWDVATRKEIRAFDNPGGWTLRLAFSPDGKILASRGFNEDVVRLWDVASGVEVRQLRDLKAGCPRLAFAPGSHTLAVNCDDGSVRLFDVLTGKETRSLAESLQPGQVNRCLGVAFAPDGRTLAAGYDDQIVRIWEIVSGRVGVEFTGHQGPTLGLAFSPDGSLLVSGGTDHIGYVWDVLGLTPAERDKASFTPKEWDRVWIELGDPDAKQGFSALRKLVANRAGAVALLRERLQPVAATNKEKIARLIADLDHAEFAKREDATKQLSELGDAAEPALRAALNEKTPPEMRRRVDDLLKQRDQSPSATLLATVRGIEALEHIGTAEARQLLQHLTKGAADARFTREAKAALERLKR